MKLERLSIENGIILKAISRVKLNGQQYRLRKNIPSLPQCIYDLHDYCMNFAHSQMKSTLNRCIPLTLMTPLNTEYIVVNLRHISFAA